MHVYIPACSSSRELKYRDSLPSWCNSVYLDGFELLFPFLLWRIISQFAKQFTISVKAHQIDSNDQWHRMTILRLYTFFVNDARMTCKRQRDAFAWPHIIQRCIVWHRAYRRMMRVQVYMIWCIQAISIVYRVTRCRM